MPPSPGTPPKPTTRTFSHQTGDRLHGCRHTCGTLMHLRGVQTAVISAWLGHASARFTMGVYVHSQTDALRDAGQTLMAAYAPAVID